MGGNIPYQEYIENGYFAREARAVVKQIYGLQPWPVATMQIGRDVFRVFSAEYGRDDISAEPGEILSTGERGIEIACGDGKSILVTELQAPGKKRMRSADFLRGRKLAGGRVTW